MIGRMRTFVTDERLNFKNSHQTMPKAGFIGRAAAAVFNAGPKTFKTIQIHQIVLNHLANRERCEEICT